MKNRLYLILLLCNGVSLFAMETAGNNNHVNSTHTDSPITRAYMRIFMNDAEETALQKATLQKYLKRACNIALPAGKIGLGLLALTAAGINTRFYIRDIQKQDEKYSLKSYMAEIGHDIFAQSGHRFMYRLWIANRHLFPWMTGSLLIGSGIHDCIQLAKEWKK